MLGVAQGVYGVEDVGRSLGDRGEGHDGGKQLGRPHGCKERELWAGKAVETMCGAKSASVGRVTGGWSKGVNKVECGLRKGWALDS